MDLPLISIIITAYNYGHTVGTAIESALRQDYPNLEVVVMDNASTDDTPAVVARYADPRLRYVRNDENIGMTPNHNAGLREARGAYVSFLSADDWLMPTFVSTSLRYLQDHPDVDVLYRGTYFADEHERITTFRQMPGQPHAPYAGGRNEFAGLLKEGCYMCFPTMLIRRELIDRYGDLDTGIKAGDYELVVRWAAAGVRFAYDPEPSCVIRIHPTQQSGAANYGSNGAMVHELIYLLDKLLTPENERLIAGSELAIARHLEGTAAYVQQLGHAPDDRLRADIERALGNLRAVRRRNLDERQPAFVTIGLLARGPLSLIDLSLRSLAQQTSDRFEVLVLYPPGPSPAPLARSIDRERRFRMMPMTGTLGDAATFNLAMRVGAGNAFTFLRSGSTFDAGHIARLCAAFDDHAAGVVLSPARVSVEQFVTHAERITVDVRDDVYAAPSLDALTVSPAVPLESLAFRAHAADAAGPFNETLHVLSHWEYVLRLRNAASIVAQSQPVHVRSYVGYADPIIQIPQIAELIEAVHRGHPADAALAQRRADYVAGVRRAIAAGLPLATDHANLLHQLQILAGTETIAEPATV